MSDEAHILDRRLDMKPFGFFDGVDLSWLNTKNYDEARKWFREKVKGFQPEVLDKLAEMYYNEKVNWELEELKKKKNDSVSS